MSTSFNSICFFFSFVSCKGKKIPKEEQESSKSKENSWQNNLDDFRIILAHEIDDVIDSVVSSVDVDTVKRKMSSYELESILNAKTEKFKGKEVIWLITFKGIDDKGIIDINETFPKKDTVFTDLSLPLSHLKWISISFKSSGQNFQQWNSIRSGQSVKCKAIIEEIWWAARYSADNLFVGYLPIVSLNEAVPFIIVDDI